MVTLHKNRSVSFTHYSFIIPVADFGSIYSTEFPFASLLSRFYISALSPNAVFTSAEDFNTKSLVFDLKSPVSESTSSYKWFLDIQKKLKIAHAGLPTSAAKSRRSAIKYRSGDIQKIVLNTEAYSLSDLSEALSDIKVSSYLIPDSFFTADKTHAKSLYSFAAKRVFRPSIARHLKYLKAKSASAGLGDSLAKSAWLNDLLLVVDLNKLSLSYTEIESVAKSTYKFWLSNYSEKRFSEIQAKRAQIRWSHTIEPKAKARDLLLNGSSLTEAVEYTGLSLSTIRRLKAQLKAQIKAEQI